MSRYLAPLTAILLAALLFSRLPVVPSFSVVRAAYPVSDSVLLDRRGHVLQETRVDYSVRRLQWTALEEIPPLLREAVIAAEDRRFYDHRGVDWRGMLGGMAGVLRGGRLRGGSTISVQLALILGPRAERRNVVHRLRAMFEASRLERRWSKEQILEAYLNLISFRGELEGIRAGAHELFGRAPHGLTPAQALILAALIRSPNARPEVVSERACRLAEQFAASVTCTEIANDIHALRVRGTLRRKARSDAPQLARRLLRGHAQEQSLRTTIDQAVQRKAEEVLAAHIAGLSEENVRDGAVLVIDHRRDEVLAYVANTGANASAPHVDGVQARRQAGSTLKPFLYGVALEQRLLTPQSLLLDAPLDIPLGRGIYRPRNYDHQFHGAVPVGVALGSSLNVPAVRTLQLVTPEVFVTRLRDAGFSTLRDADEYGYSLALGSPSVSLEELTNAYAALARGGLYRQARLTPGERLPGRQFLSEQATFLVSSMLSERDYRAVTFGLDGPLNTRFWSAVKTGTSRDMTDNWCIGYSRRFTVGVWVGNFSGAAMWNVTGVTGAAPIWADLITWLEQQAGGALPPPEAPTGVVRRKARLSGVERELFVLAEMDNGDSADDAVLVDESVVSPGAVSTVFSQPRIVYPPKAMTIASDPDIPDARERLMLESSGDVERARWVVNGVELGPAPRPVLLDMTPGRSVIELVGANGEVLDRSTVTVLGGKAKR